MQTNGIPSVRSRASGNPDPSAIGESGPGSPLSRGRTEPVSFHAFHFAMILMVRRAKGPSRNMNAATVRTGQRPHPSTRRLRRLLRMRDKFKQVRACRIAPASPLANAPPPGGLGRRGRPSLVVPRPSRGVEHREAHPIISALMRRGARPVTTRTPPGAPHRGYYYRTRATLSKPVAGFNQPAPGGGFVVTPGWSPGTPGGAVASRASRSRTLLRSQDAS